MTEELPEAPEQPVEHIQGEVQVKIEYKDGVAAGITWEWDPPEANVALILREALDPLLTTHNDHLGRQHRKYRRLNPNLEAIQGEVGDLNGSGG